MAVSATHAASTMRESITGLLADLAIGVTMKMYAEPGPGEEALAARLAVAGAGQAGEGVSLAAWHHRATVLAIPEAVAARP